jgi:hypothetical protein
MAALVPFNPNVFFQRVAAERQDAQGVQNAIAGLADAYKESKKAPEMPDFEKAAQRVALARASGVEPDPQDMLTVEAGAMIYAPQPVQNPVTGEFYTKETPFSLLTKGQSKPQTFGGALQGGYEYQPEIPRQGAFKQVPQIDASMLEEGAPMNVGRGTPLPTAGAPQGGGTMPAPMTQQMAAPKGINAPRTGYLKSDVAAATEAAKADIELQQKQAEKQMEKESDRPRAERAVQNAFTDFNVDSSFIDKAIEQVSPFTAGAGSYLGMIAGTPASDLRNTLSTIQADSAFGRLQQMREASKTGGALGAVSERELTLLQNAAAPLGQDQSPAQLKENLEKYKRVRQNALKQVAEAFKQDYGYYPKGINMNGGQNAMQEKGQGQAPSQEINELLEYMTPEERALFNGQ